MTFSLRDLLALVLLSALGMSAWRSAEEASRRRTRATLLENEIKLLEVKVRLDQPELQQAIVRTHDEFRPLHALRQRSLEHVEVLRRKYSLIELRGPQVLSLRSVPSLSTDQSPAPVVFRLQVPAERPVWLKFGVHPTQQNMHSSRTPDDERDLLTDSPFEPSGPFEVRLEPGEQTLSIALGSSQEGALPVEMRLDDRVLLRTSFVSPIVTGTGWSQPSATSQLDFDGKQELPWLITATMSLDSSTPSSQMTHAFSIWLSDRSSKFDKFPGK